ncbi:hypothetical protein H8E52_05640, partial [bacterium]|nr:hypothetical protein [bacterium]
MIQKSIKGILLCLILLPVSPAFSENHLSYDLDPATASLDDKEIDHLAGLISQLELAWSELPSDSLWPLMDVGPGAKFWTVMRRDSLRYSDCFRSALADSGTYREFQQTVWSKLRSRLHGLLDFHPRRTSLVRSGDGINKLVFLDKLSLVGRMENMEKHATHPQLNEILILSLLTPIDWQDPLFTPWREAEARHSGIAWQDFNPGLQDGMSLMPKVRDKKGVEAQVDSLFQVDERLKNIGWLKKRFVKKAMKVAMLEMLTMEAAWEEIQRQEDGLFGDAPACPLVGKTVMRFVFLRKNSF